jgi:murein L,D-transpeptidase YcbB/YkuD
VQQPAPIVVPPAQIEPSAFLPVPRAWQIDKAILKRKVEALMGEPKAGLVHIADGRPIHPGERSPEMPAIRAALHSFGYLSQETPPALLEPAALPSKLPASKLRAATNPAFVYDDATLEAVKNFQADEGLMDDGIIGGATRRALRSQDSDRLLRLNQTLAQHAIPLASKGREIVVNIAAGLVYALEDGKVVLVSRAVVGNPTHQTPLFSTRIVSVTLNPYWTTPDSITKAEFGGSTHIEHPGPDNPLGKFRLDMPNRYEVFLHSTNEPKLFDRDVRAYSHGCVRVEKVEALAKWLVGDQVWKTTDADATLKTWKYKQIKLSASVPVYLAYWTSSVGSGGQVIYHADPYKLAVPPAPPPAYPVPPGYIGPPPSYGAPPTTVAATRIAVKRPVAKGTTAHRIVHRPSSVQPAPIVEASTMHATGYTTAAVSLPMERN